MIFRETPLKGSYLIQPERIEDERGFFARTWAEDEFSAHGLSTKLVQCNVSFNRKRATLRGMHFQADPYGEIKLVRCTMGAIFDVIIDLRPDSPTYKHYTSAELTAENRHAFYIPVGFAHGFITLTDNAEVFYQMSSAYHAPSARGVRWDDQVFGIQWPLQPEVISERDRNLVDFTG